MKKILACLVPAMVYASLASADELRAFPPPPPVKSPIEGAIDFHVHSAPDVFGRSVTDIEAATLARRAGMRAIVLKNHVTSTADRAAVVREVVPGIEVFGGIVLNRAVGGVESRRRGMDGADVRPLRQGGMAAHHRLRQPHAALRRERRRAQGGYRRQGHARGRGCAESHRAREPGAGDRPCRPG